MSNQAVIDAAAFARDWVAAWNRRDAEAVLAHYREDAVFVSPRTAAMTGNGEVQGKAALRAYWNAALERNRELRFQLDSAPWDEASRTITVIYVAEIGGSRLRACEVMRFDADGHIVRGEAFHGAPLA